MIDSSARIVTEQFTSTSTILSFKSIESKHDVYRGKDCMKTFYESLREHAVKITNIKKKKNQAINKRTAGKCLII